MAKDKAFQNAVNFLTAQAADVTKGPLTHRLIGPVVMSCGVIALLRTSESHDGTRPIQKVATQTYRFWSNARSHQFDLVGSLYCKD